MHRLAVVKPIELLVGDSFVSPGRAGVVQSPPIDFINSIGISYQLNNGMVVSDMLDPEEPLFIIR